MRPGHVNLPKDEAKETVRAAAYERKQKWKELPGNRYTPEELQVMSETLGPIEIREQEAHVMRLY